MQNWDTLHSANYATLNSVMDSCREQIVLLQSLHTTDEFDGDCPCKLEHFNFPDYAPSSANFKSLYGIGGVLRATYANRANMSGKLNLRLKR